MVDKIEVDLELRERWLQALESGSYKQGKNVLRSNDNKFCCLGVLADLSGVEWTNSPNMIDAYEYRTVSDTPQSIFTDLDLNNRVGIFMYDGEVAEMNDGGKSFKEIAAFIRERGIDNGDQDE